MAFDAFLTLDGIDNGALIPVTYFTLNVTPPASTGTSLGVSETTPQVTMSVIKVLDISSPKLFQALALGTGIKGGSLVIQGTFNLTYALTDIYITSITDEDHDGGALGPSETISLTFEKIVLTNTIS